MSDKERMGEIAIKLLKYRLTRGTDGIRANEFLVRNIESISKEMGIPIKELKEFVAEIISEVVDEQTKKKE
ncbi:hypothetical protein HY839_01410 [Candidatus Azambacteria bacterium]|nr:hypothetical protein [Candidatus Azambacteria bacterium]